MELLTPFSLQPRQLHRFMSYSELLERDIPRQLTEKSTQPHILKFCHEDSKRRGRFGSEIELQRWMNVGRIVYGLCDKQDLQGICWFRRTSGEEVDAEHRITFGIRIYEGAVGNGLARPFMRATHVDVMQFYEDTGFWLSVHRDNLGARSLYESIGYVTHHRNSEREFMAMDHLSVV